MESHLLPLIAVLAAVVLVVLLLRALVRAGHKRPVPTPPVVLSPPPSAAGELERLAELRRTGALTDQEYSDAKARVLGGT